MPASIDCQKAAEHLLPDGATIAAANRTGRAVAFNSQGLQLSSRNGASQVRIHGYLQADGRLFTANLEGQQRNVLLFRRVRPLIEGTLANHIDFRFMPDFGEGNTVIQEAYAEMAIAPGAMLRIGKFKTPIGLEVLRSDRDLTFAERSLTSDLIPIRDLGAQLELSFLRNKAICQLGYFSGAPDGANANFEWRGDGEGVARFFLQPFNAASSPPAHDLGAGIALSQGHKQNALPGIKTIGQSTFFQFAPGVLAGGTRRHISPQAYYFFRSFGLLAEYTVSAQDMTAPSAHRPLANHGWEISSSLVLTGERNSYDGVQPAHSFEPAAGLRHFGAWEIAVRHSAVDIDPHAFPDFASPALSAQRASESSVGLNWYINRHTKLVTDFEYTIFRMHADGFAPLPTERVTMTRLQFAL
jgi:phosphate-selective porin OprO/OprP